MSVFERWLWVEVGGRAKDNYANQRSKGQKRGIITKIVVVRSFGFEGTKGL